MNVFETIRNNKIPAAVTAVALATTAIFGYQAYELSEARSAVAITQKDLDRKLVEAQNEILSAQGEVDREVVDRCNIYQEAVTSDARHSVFLIADALRADPNSFSIENDSSTGQISLLRKGETRVESEYKSGAQRVGHFVTGMTFTKDTYGNAITVFSESSAETEFADGKSPEYHGSVGLSVNFAGDESSMKQTMVDDIIIAAENNDKASLVQAFMDAINPPDLSDREGSSPAFRANDFVLSDMEGADEYPLEECAVNENYRSNLSRMVTGGSELSDFVGESLDSNPVK